MPLTLNTVTRLFIAALLTLSIACTSQAIPTSTPTLAPTPTATPTATPAPESSPTSTPDPTPTVTPSPTPTPAATPIATPDDLEAFLDRVDRRMSDLRGFHMQGTFEAKSEKDSTEAAIFMEFDGDIARNGDSVMDFTMELFTEGFSGSFAFKQWEVDGISYMRDPFGEWEVEEVQESEDASLDFFDASYSDIVGISVEVANLDGQAMYRVEGTVPDDDEIEKAVMWVNTDSLLVHRMEMQGTGLASDFEGLLPQENEQLFIFMAMDFSQFDKPLTIVVPPDAPPFTVSASTPDKVPVPTVRPPPATVIQQGKLTVAVSSLGNERYDKAFSLGVAINQGRLLHGMIVATNERTELVPGIASDWNLSPDGTAFNFTIRDGVQFHDGTVLTPEDVRWSLDHNFGPKAFEYVTGGTARAFSTQMESIELTEPNVVTAKFSRIETSFLGYISEAGPSWVAYMPARDALRDEVLEAAYEKAPIGTGPMKFVRAVPAELMVWERFDDYYFQSANGLYEDRRVNFTTLDLWAVPNEATRVAALRAGEVDIAPASFQAKELLEARGGRLVFGKEGSYLQALLLGCWDQRLACGDIRVRQALAYAIDKELMREFLFGPEIMEVKGWAAVTPSTIGYSPDLDPYPFDPDKARQLLAESGYKTPTNPDGKDFGPLVVNTWVSPVFPLLPESAQLAAEMWKRELGLDTEVRVGGETAIRNARKAGELNGQILWGDNETRLDATSIVRRAYGDLNNPQRLHEDPEIFAMVQAALAEHDPVKREQALNPLYLRLKRESYEIGVGYVNIPWGVGPRVLNWQPYPRAFWLSALHTTTLRSATTPIAPGKKVIKFHDGQWETLREHNAIAMYITENGYGYPVEQVTGTTGTMKVALPQGDLDVNLELWQNNVADWYHESVAAGTLVDLAGQFGNVENGATGQTLETSMQGIYVPTYMVEQNPDLKTVSDLAKYKELIKDPEDPSKGVVVNCIIGWSCQKIIRAKWHAYGLVDDLNLLEPGAAAAIDANILETRLKSPAVTR